jgi:hypothetical protein
VGSLKIFYQVAVSEERALPRAVIAIQSFGDFLGFNPHLQVLCTDGCFYGDGIFRVATRFGIKELEEVFRHKVFKMLLSKGKITQDLLHVTVWKRMKKYHISLSEDLPELTH